MARIGLHKEGAALRLAGQDFGPADTGRRRGGEERK
jgi:hypothetical protein